MRREHSDEVLAVKRGYGPMADLWEFPGGKVERGETADAAVRRELAEELGVRIENVRAFYTVEYPYEDFHLSMECFFCQIAGKAEGGEAAQGGDAGKGGGEDRSGGASKDASTARNDGTPCEDKALDEGANGSERAGEGENDHPNERATVAEGEEANGGEVVPSPNDRQQEIRWVPRRELDKLEWMPADEGLVRELVALREDEAGAPRKKKSKLLRNIRTKDLSTDERELVRRRAAVKKSMKGNKRANTKPEMLVRERLRAAGLTGYRLQWKKAPGRPDIAFVGLKVAIFVNGCFWHRCPNCNPSMPKHNVEFWEAKFTRNIARDQRALAELEQMGWQAITIWECELKRDHIDATMERVVKAVRAARTKALAKP